MDEIQLVKQLATLLSSNETAKKRYAHNIKWLEERKDLWKANTVRVGIIGVTSSGKSTLINTLLAEELLPTAVRPSSSRLVTCRKGPIKEAKIHFEDNQKICRLRDKQVTSKEITKYADEEYNPENKKQVKQIEIQTPQFAFSEEIMLIDSPGLDAYNLEAHEKLTMEILLPTIDVCIFVTTLKANTDDTTLRLLNAIETHQKPLIIVQNMLDSVEAKKGTLGKILKSKEEVAYEHKQRVQKIIEKSQLKNKELVDVIQVSAKLGLKYIKNYNKEKWRESGIPILIDTVNKRVKMLEPNITKQRYLQIKQHIQQELMSETTEEKYTTDIQVTNLMDVNQLQQRVNGLIQYCETKNDAILNLLYSMEDYGISANEAIERLDESSMQQCKDLLNTLKIQLQRNQNQIVTTIQEVGKEFDKVFEQLNLNRAEQYKRPALKAVTNISMHTKSVTRRRKVEKAGFTGKVGRFFGGLFNNYSMGYEYKTYEDEILDKQETKECVSNICAIIEDAYEVSIIDWQKKNNEAIEILRQEIKRRKEQEKAHQDYLLSVEENKKLMQGLRKINSQIGDTIKILEKQIKDTKVKSNYKQQISTTYRQVAMTQGTVAIYEMAHHLIADIFNCIYKNNQDLNHKRIKNLRGTVIWAWDIDSIESFVQRFIKMPITLQEKEQLKKEGYLNKSGILLVYESGLNRQTDKKLQEVFRFTESSLYILVNGIQMGACCKQLAESRLSKMPQMNNQVANIVLQSFNEFRFNDEISQVVPVLCECRKMLQHMKEGQFLINDSNPFYSLLLLELQMMNKVTLADETELIKYLTNHFGDLIGQELSSLSIIMKSFTKEKNNEETRRL